MPGPQTAAMLIQTVRNLINHQSPNVYRDGYVAGSLTPDADTDGIPILKWINLAHNELLATGICKCWFLFTTVAGKSEYTLDEGAHEIQHCLINGIPLKATSFLGLDVISPGWQGGNGARPGLPTQYYTYSDQIGLNPYPDGPYSVYYLADSWPGDMVNPADTPQRLPVRFHTALATRAAWWLSNIDVENEVAAKRLPALMQAWEKDYADVQSVANHRLADLDDQIQAGDYRHEFGWGSRY